MEELLAVWVSVIVNLLIFVLFVSCEGDLNTLFYELRCGFVFC